MNAVYESIIKGLSEAIAYEKGKPDTISAIKKVEISKKDSNNES